MIMPLCDYVSPATTALGRQADCWEDAVRQAGALLEKAGAIAPAYTQAMVDMVREMGPYIVIMPGVALAMRGPREMWRATASLSSPALRG